MLFPVTRLARQQFKDTYHVDAYLQDLSDTPAALVKKPSYWYSMWSHRRNHVWKGFVQVDLDPMDDGASIIELDNLEQQGTPP